MYYSIMFSGTQGDGVDTIGELMGAILHDSGFWVYGYRNFSSRIKGGYSSVEITFAKSPVRVKKTNPDILVCLSMEGLKRDLENLSMNGIAILDDSLKDVPVEIANQFSLPLSKAAREGPGEVYKWVVALGALLGFVKLAPHAPRELLAEMFAHKGENIIKKNLAALEMGLELWMAPQMDRVVSNPLGNILSDSKVPVTKRRLVKGSDAIAEAALAAGCNFTSGYPISPASEVFEYLAREFRDERGNAVQTEDEISALDMAIGASYAGATALVTTSGPGFSLMVEGIGLAFMAQVPVVLVNAQRSGPSTGMPSKHEQSDIELALAGSHGDVSPVIFSPSSLEDIYTDLPRAFVLAEKHRTPVIFLTDFAMMVSRASVGGLAVPDVNLKELREQRDIPGTAGKMHHRTGNQRGHNGLPTDLAQVRKELFDQHLAGLPRELEDGFSLVDGGHELLIMGIGSTRGAVEIALEGLGGQASALFLRILSPLPSEALREIVERFKNVLVVDSNAKGQLLKLLKTHLKHHDKLHSLKKYDGEPFTPEEIISRSKEVFQLG